MKNNIKIVSFAALLLLICGAFIFASNRSVDRECLSAYQKNTSLLSKDSSGAEEDAYARYLSSITMECAEALREEIGPEAAKVLAQAGFFSVFVQGSSIDEYQEHLIELIASGERWPQSVDKNTLKWVIKASDGRINKPESRNYETAKARLWLSEKHASEWNGDKSVLISFAFIKDITLDDFELLGETQENYDELFKSCNGIDPILLKRSYFERYEDFVRYTDRCREQPFDQASDFGQNLYKYGLLDGNCSGTMQVNRFLNEGYEKSLICKDTLVDGRFYGYVISDLALAKRVKN